MKSSTSLFSLFVLFACVGAVSALQSRISFDTADTTFPGGITTYDDSDGSTPATEEGAVDGTSVDGIFGEARQYNATIDNKVKWSPTASQFSAFSWCGVMTLEGSLDDQATAYSMQPSIIDHQYDGSTMQWYLFSYGDGFLDFQIYSGDGNDVLDKRISQNDIPQDTPFQMCVVYDGSNSVDGSAQTFYIDEQEVSSTLGPDQTGSFTVTTFDYTTSYFTFAGHWNGADGSLQGSIDEMYFQDSAMLAQDVIDVFSSLQTLPACDISFTNTPCNAAGMVLDSSYYNYVLSDVFVDNGELTITGGTGPFPLSGNITLVGYNGISHLRFDSFNQCVDNNNLDGVNLNVLISSPSYRPEIAFTNPDRVGTVNLLNPDSTNVIIDSYSDGIDPQQCGVVTSRMTFDDGETGDLIAPSGEMSGSILLTQNQVVVNNPTLSAKGVMRLEGNGILLSDGYKLFHDGVLAVENVDYTVTSISDDGTYITQAFFVVNQAYGTWNMYAQSFFPSQENSSVSPPSLGGGGRLTGRATTEQPPDVVVPSVVSPPSERTLWQIIIGWLRGLFK